MSFFYNKRNPPLETKRTVRRDERPAERRFTLVHKDWDEEEEEEWEEDEDGCEYIEQHDVAALWRIIEHNRATIAEQEARFQRWLQWSPELRKHWQAFINAGGVTSSDFEKFCQGTMRHRSMREKKHLRLVRDNAKPIRRIRLNPTGNDAA